MSDPNKFINTYIDTVIAALHEQLGNNLQLKTQLKLANDLLQEKDGTITHLSDELENTKKNQENINSVHGELSFCQEKLRIAEDSYTALKVKVSHMDTLTRQLIDMKNEIKIRDDQISSLNNELAKLQNQPDQNKLTIKSEKTKTTPKESSVVNVQLNTKNKPKKMSTDDDF